MQQLLISGETLTIQLPGLGWEREGGFIYSGFSNLFLYQSKLVSATPRPRWSTHRRRRARSITVRALTLTFASPAFLWGTWPPENRTFPSPKFIHKDLRDLLKNIYITFCLLANMKRWGVREWADRWIEQLELIQEVYGSIISCMG